MLSSRRLREERDLGALAAGPHTAGSAAGILEFPDGRQENGNPSMKKKLAGPVAPRTRSAPGVWSKVVDLRAGQPAFKEHGWCSSPSSQV
jgi:hypothetical protein